MFSSNFAVKSLRINISQTRNISKTFKVAQECRYLTRGNGNKLAYRQLMSDNLSATGVIFCSGFQSNMQGVKAIALERYCESKNLPYIRFDYQGCGESTGDLRELTISDWRGDVMTILDELTAGPQIMIGSSMGGLLMLHAAMSRPNRVKALVGIATAADMPERMFSNYPGKILETVAAEGECVYTTDQHEYVITKRFVEDAPAHSILTRDLIPITCPVRLLHGMRDESVPYQVSLDLARKLQSRSVDIHFRKAGDHRFSQPEDIQMLFEVLNFIIHGSDQVRNLAIESFEAFSRYSHVEQSDVLTRTRARDR